MLCHLRAPLGCLQTILGTSCVLGLGQPQSHCMTWGPVPSLSLFPTCKMEQKSEADDSAWKPSKGWKMTCHDLPALEFKKEGSCSPLVPSTLDRTGHRMSVP